MKLLVDNALSPALARLLSGAGHDAVHLRERMAVDSPDEAVFDLAASENRVIISADTDFGVILANRRESHPSFILLRHDAPVLPAEQAELLDRVINRFRVDLEAGAVVSARRETARVRRLPLR